MIRSSDRKSFVWATRNVRMSYTREALTPQVPLAQDVLYALRLIDTDEQYEFCRANSEIYVSNCHLVAAAVSVIITLTCYQVENETADRTFHKLNEARARSVIAQAIIDLLPSTVDEHDAGYRQALIELHNWSSR